MKVKPFANSLGTTVQRGQDYGRRTLCRLRLCSTALSSRLAARALTPSAPMPLPGEAGQFSRHNLYANPPKNTPPPNQKAKLGRWVLAILGFGRFHCGWRTTRTQLSGLPAVDSHSNVFTWDITKLEAPPPKWVLGSTQEGNFPPGFCIFLNSQIWTQSEKGYCCKWKIRNPPTMYIISLKFFSISSLIILPKKAISCSQLVQEPRRRIFRHPPPHGQLFCPPRTQNKKQQIPKP